MSSSFLDTEHQKYFSQERMWLYVDTVPTVADSIF